MSQATVVAQYVNPVATGKKNGSIKTPEGTYYGVPPGILSLFQPGGTYTIQYESRMFNGKEFHTVKSVVPAAGGGAGESHAPARKYGQVDDATAERIFVQGLLQAYIKAGKIEPTPAAVIGGIKALRSAWAETFGKPKTQAEGEMNDEIPW